MSPARRPAPAAPSACEVLEGRRLLTTLRLNAAGGADQTVVLDADVSRVVLTDDAGLDYGDVSIDASGSDGGPGRGTGVTVRFDAGVVVGGFSFVGSAGEDHLGEIPVADGGEAVFDFIEGGDDVIDGVAGGAEVRVFTLSGVSYGLGDRRGTIDLAEFDDWAVADTLTLVGGSGRQTYTGALDAAGARLALELSWHDLVEDVTVPRDLTLNYGDGQNRAFSQNLDVGGSLFVNLGERSNFVRLHDVNAAGSVVVAGAGGADRLKSDGLTARGLSVDLGDGYGSAEFRNLSVRGQAALAARDTADFFVSGAIGGNVKLDGDRGRQSLSLKDAAVGKNLSARTGGGADRVHVRRSAVGRANLSLGAGGDSVVLRDATLTGGGRFDLGNGDDAFSAEKVVAGGRLSVTGDSGADRVTTSRSRFERLIVRGGNGADRLAADRTDVTDRLFANLGAGDDVLELARSRGVASLALARGRGEDVLVGLEDFAGDLLGDLRGYFGDDFAGDVRDLADDARDGVRDLLD